MNGTVSSSGAGDRRSPRGTGRRHGPTGALVVALVLAATPTAPAPAAAQVIPGATVLTEPAGRDPDAPLVGWSPPGDEVVRYEAPVAGALVEGFRAPQTLFGPGHRGVKLAAEPGSAVGAAADGVVHHAGEVAGVPWVSIVHADGTLTSYGPVSGITVAEGDRVRRGEVIGTATTTDGAPGPAEVLHWGARRGMVYVDPLDLLGAGMPRPSLVGPGSWEGSHHVVHAYEPWEGRRWGGLALHPSPVATSPGFAVPPTPNHLVTINGLATRSGSMPFDPRDLGFAPESVTALSYAGRQLPADGSPMDPDDPWRDQRPYGPEDTWSGVVSAARRLEDQLREIRRREPGRAVDIVGHSMGGVAAIWYLTHLHDPYDPGLPSISSVVTIASPHQGSDLAQMARWLRAEISVQAALDAALGRSWAHDVPQRELTPLDMPALDQLATGSELLDDHAQAWDRTLRRGASGPIAMGTRVLTVSGSSDVVATPSRSVLPDPTRTFGVPADVTARALLPGGHEGVKESEVLRTTVWRFLREGSVDAPGGTLTARLTNLTGTSLRMTGFGVWSWLNGPVTAYP